MARILTGVQSTGTPHLGNIIGAVLPAIEMAKNEQNQSFLFIADFHSLTQIKDESTLRKNTFETASTWLAFGLNPNKTIFYKQSDVSEVTELAWYLSCFFPFKRLTLAHSFKDKSANLKDINTGLFSYPMLMAADILLYDADIVPVGKDQLQHIEMTRDVASRFNNTYGETLIVPSSLIDTSIKFVPGTDGNKMSKSKNNLINVFLEKEKLKKQIMGIKTDSKNINEPKDFSSCTIFNLYKILAEKKDIEKLKNKYSEGNIGYGEAKQLLFELILNKFKNAREKFTYFQNNPEKVEIALSQGAVKAKKIAQKTLKRVRAKLGY
ncbi:MAG: tryptophan--tRNA ligase [Flavobacteriaceae bacterium]|nr:tryptophan--tRNA ligase [Flavobacteriaceae bacterium]